MCREVRFMKKKKVVVFDFDGTLCDSFPLVVGKMTEALTEFRKEPLTEEESKNLYGPTEEGIIYRLFKDKGIAKECFTRYLSLYSRDHEKMLPSFYPGILDLLKELKTKNIHVYLLTGRCKETTSITLSKFDAFDYFKAIYTGGIDGEVKEIRLNELCETHHYKPEELIYIGDSLRDVPQCRKANVDIFSVCYLNMSNKEQLEEINPNNVCSTVEDLRNKILSLF